MPKIGPTFIDDLRRAGIKPDGIAWSADGDITFTGVDEAKQAAVLAVLEAHDPARLGAAAVDALRNEKLAGGYQDAETGETYQTRPGTDDIAILTALGAAAGNAANAAGSFPIITADNSIVVLSPADCFALINGRVMPWFSAIMLHASGLKSAIAAGGNPDINAGWPI